jgi:hypothetical protein
MMIGFYQWIRAKVSHYKLSYYIELLPIQIGYHLHNHESTEAATHPSSRQMTLEQHKIIEQQLRAGIGPAKTYAFLKQAYPTSRIIMKDVYNARDRVKF